MLDSAFGCAESQGATADVAWLGAFTRGEAAAAQYTDKATFISNGKSWG